MSDFPCTQCGACCIDVRRFGLPTAEDGKRCANLQADMSCGIYETRPEVCRIDFQKPFGMPRGVWYALGQRACQTLQERTGLKPRVEIERAHG